MRATFLRALTATTALVSAMAGGAAFADCQPDPAASGQTVTCSGTDPNGFAAGAAANLTFNVLTGATVTAGAGTTVLLNGGSIVTNAGTIASPTFFGMQFAGAGNTITNLGTMTAAITAISAPSASNTIINRGTITADVAVNVGGNATTIINSGAITANVAIQVIGTGTVITNSGTLTVNGGSFAIRQVGSSGTVTNSGTIAASGIATLGIESDGNNNTVINSGTITASGTSHPGGIAILPGVSNTVINSGTITAAGSASGGQPSFGILLVDAGFGTIANLGVIAATGPGSAGISFFDGSYNNTVTNSGTIRATGAGAMALDFENFADDNNFTNAAGGLVFADASVGAVAAGSLNPGATGTLINNGTIDGRLATITAGLQVVNNGLIQITTGAVGQTHAIGAFTQTAGGTLALRVNAAAGHDTLGTAGATVLGGTLRAVMQPGLYGNSTLYTNVVTATAGIGTQFASVVATSPFFTASAAYGANAVNLTLTRIPFGAVPGLTQNQLAIGNALEAGYSPGATGAAATIYGTLFGGTTVPSYDGLSGEVGTGVQNPTFALGDAFLNAIAGQMQRWRSGMTGAPGTQSANMRVQFAAAPLSSELASFELSQSYAQAAAPGAEPWPPRSVGPHWAAWASGFGLNGNRDGDGTVGSARLGYSMGGGAFGADAQLAPNLLLGGAVSGAGSDFSLDGRAASGTARAVFFGVYGTWTMGPLYVDAAASYGLASFSTTRIASLNGINERATGDFDGHQIGGRVEAGWRFLMQRTELTPFAGLTVQSLHQDDYSESATNLGTGGAGVLGLGYQSQTTTSVRSSLGAQAATTFQLGERTTVTPRVRAAWAHEFNDDRLVGASFLSIPGAAFTVNGARPARDAALVSAGVDVGIGRNVTLYAQFDSELASAGNAYAGSGGLRISW